MECNLDSTSFRGTRPIVNEYQGYKTGPPYIYIYIYIYTLHSMKVDSLKVDLVRNRSRRKAPDLPLKVDLVISRFVESGSR